MKSIRPFLSLFLLSLSFNLFSQSAEEVVQANLDAYNKGDIETFMKYISDDIEMFNVGECESYLQGKEAVRELYANYFERSPDLHSKIKKRIVFDNKVIDHEYITGANGKSEAFEMVFMYEIENGLIARTRAIRVSK